VGGAVYSGSFGRDGRGATSEIPEVAMFVFALTVMIAQPVPKAPEFKLEPLIAKAIEADPNDSLLRKLQKERCRERAHAIAQITGVIQIGAWNPTYYTDYIRLQMTFWENLAELADTPANKVKYYERRIDAAKEIEQFFTVRVNAGNEPPHTLSLARATRIDAEIDLLKLKAEVEKGGKK
jgi:hypothetical protein